MFWRKKNKRQKTGYVVRHADNSMRERKKIRRTAVYKRHISSAIKKMLIASGLLVIFGTILYFLFFVEKYSIEQLLPVRRDLRVDTSGVEKYLKKYEGSNIFALRGSKIERDIVEIFPTIDRAELEKIYPNKVKIDLYGVPVPFKWECVILEKTMLENGDTIEEEKSSIKYINQNGYLSSPEEDEAQTAFLILERYTCPESVKKNKPIFSQNFLAGMIYARDKIEKALGKKIIRLEYLRYAQEFHFITEDETSVWIDFFSGFEMQIKKLEIAVNAERGKPLLASPVHIDLRVGNKIFYLAK